MPQKHNLQFPSFIRIQLFCVQFSIVLKLRNVSSTYAVFNWNLVQSFLSLVEYLGTSIDRQHKSGLGFKQPLATNFEQLEKNKEKTRIFQKKVTIQSMNGVLPRGYNALSEHSPVVTAVCVFIFLYDLLFMFPKIDLNCKK